MAGDSDSESPKTTSNTSTNRPDATADTKDTESIIAKTEQPSNGDVAKPLAPPPRPAQAQKGNTPDYFTLNVAVSLNQEPNPFERSFGGDSLTAGGGPPETPGGTKLPPVAAITSPSSLLPGTGNTPFNWGGGSLRTGPLSPAMLSAPQTDYFSDQFRGGFPTPNESSLRTGLTPGGSGSMFPVIATPNTAALFNLGPGGATPGTVDFHRTAMRAAAVEREQQAQQQLPVTSQPQELTNGAAPVKQEIKPTGPFDNHDNDAANGLFMLAQGRNGAQPQQSQYPVPPQPAGHGHPAPAVQHPDTDVNGKTSHGSGSRGASESGSMQSEDSEQARPNTRGKGKRNSGAGVATTNGRRKAEDAPAKTPATKKAKLSVSGSVNGSIEEHDDDDQDEEGGDKPKSKMTEEEKRKNFLERNRVAALKCRQRKKQWLANLQNKVDLYQTENDQLTQQIAALREEVVNLKTLLLAHKDCPVTQQQGMPGAYMAGMEYNAQMNPYGMAAPIPNHQMMPAQAGQRRFS
ncbi:Transcription factor [Cytospora paraplurivora]|uniref:Transcription factor n=1 Tax=Cytospora paraplurivora TaxID=2898453 RepID=A0AAN9UBR2_9PEZI